MIVAVIGFVVGCVAVRSVPWCLMRRRGLHQENDEVRQDTDGCPGCTHSSPQRQAKKDVIVPVCEEDTRRSRPSGADGCQQNSKSRIRPLCDVPHGKTHVEHGTNIHLRKTGTLPLAKFLESLEKSGYQFAISRLEIRKRSGENDAFDVECGVASISAWSCQRGEPIGSAKP